MIQLTRLAVLLSLAACAAPPAPRPQHAATIPVEHAEAAARNAELVARARGAQAPLVLLGDSITQGWEDAGRAAWTETLAPLGALDLGVGGDRTEHLLFRLQSGAYDAVPVRVAVIMIGTNNLGTGQSPEMTADGVAAVVDDVLARWPKCEVLLLAIFPRGVTADDPLRQLVARTNPLAHAFANRERVTWLDIGDKFLAPDGTLPTATMPDALHLSESGYRTWAAQLEPPLVKLLGVTPVRAGRLSRVPAPTIEIHADADAGRRAVANRLDATLRTRGPRGLNLALPTGSTPLGLYTELVRRHREEGLSFAPVTTFGLDEYWPLPAGDPRGFAHFLDEALLDPVGHPRSQRRRLDGSVRRESVDRECARYEAELSGAGGLDLALLGLGKNGHIAFCEPGSARDSRTRLLELEEGTLVDVRAAFGNDPLPRHALSMGIATLLEAKEIVLMAFGAGKRDVVARALEGPIGPACPASFLREHPRTSFVLDRDAASRLRAAG